MEKLKDLRFGEKADKSPDTSDIDIVINELAKVVHILRQEVEDLESRSATSDEGIRKREENADEIKQRQLKGSYSYPVQSLKPVVLHSSNRMKNYGPVH